MSGFALRPLAAPLVVLAMWSGAAAAAATSSPRGAGPAAARPAFVPLRLPAPIVYERTVGRDSAVTFSHETHVALAGNRCLGCHPEPFRMLKPLRRIVHADMDSGRSCGRCHDGRSAFGVTEPSACQTCHAGSGEASLAVAPGGAGSPAASAGVSQAGASRRPLPRSVAFARGESSPGPVRFRHETHMREGTACQACHPKPYRMKATGGRPGGAMHEPASCGACHDGRKAFGVEDAESCALCHAQGAQP